MSLLRGCGRSKQTSLTGIREATIWSRISCTRQCILSCMVSFSSQFLFRCLYANIYAASSKFIDEEVVELPGAVEKWTGKGVTVPIDGREPSDLGTLKGTYSAMVHIPKDFWSETYQWLPANLAFQEDGAVKFTGYINNLHPDEHLEIYKTIEKLVDIAIPAWDHVLHGFTRIASREPNGDQAQAGPANDKGHANGDGDVEDDDDFFDEDANDDFPFDDDELEDYEDPFNFYDRWQREEREMTNGKSNHVRFGLLTKSNYEGIACHRDSGIWEKINTTVLAAHEREHEGFSSRRR